MNHEELHRRLLETFALEMEEHLQTMANTLAQLETEKNELAGEQSGEPLNQLFRAVHSLKGAARSVDLIDIEEHCHKLESLLSGVRTAARPLTQQEMQCLYEGLLWLQERNLQPDLPDNAELPPSYRAADDNKVKEQTQPAQGGQVQHSVRLPAARLDRLLSLLAEIQLVGHSGSQLLHNIDELELIYARQRHKSAPRSTQTQTRTTAETGKKQGRLVPANRRADDHQEVKQLIHALRKRAAKYLLELELAIQPLEREIHSSRLQSFGSACEAIQTFVNTEKSEGKSGVRLLVAGQDVELDRALIEGVRPVLMHLVRNALDHGMESIQQRIAKGKPECGEIRITAQRVKGLTNITVQDDGQGVDEEKLVAVLQSRGLVIPRDRASLLNTLFEPGLSTAALVSKVSGRGVGLDAVRSAVQGMRGTIAIESVPGKGVTFQIQLPQTLSAYRVLVVEIGLCRYAIDAAQVKLTRRIKQQELIESEQGVFISIDQQHYALGTLGKHLGEGSTSTQAQYAIILTDNRIERALLVDRVVGLESVVVKDLEAKLGKVEGISGGAIMGDGSVALLLDPAFFLKQHYVRLDSLIATDSETRNTRQVTVLVAEDAMTTRILEVNVLESAGYQVVACVDGQQAWQALRENVVDIVVSDIDMPHLNGFELTRKIRDSAKWSHIPVILLTARTSQEDKLAGLHAGANVYMNKSHFDQSELLDAVNRLAPL